MRASNLSLQSRKTEGKRGNAMVVVMACALISTLMIAWQSLTNLRSIQVDKRQLQSRTLTEPRIAMEAFMVSWYGAMATYYITVANMPGCISANSFSKALIFGSGCAGPVIHVWSNQTIEDKSGRAPIALYEGGPPEAPPLYTFARVNGCAIGQSSSTCSGGNFPLINISNAVDPFPGLAVLRNAQVWLTYIDKSSGALRVTARFMKPGSTTVVQSEFSFSMRSNEAGFAQIEQNGVVTQSQPNPLDKCEGTKFGPYALWNETLKKCQIFMADGLGLGLARFDESMLAFRSYDGRIADLTRYTINPFLPYLVEESVDVGTPSTPPSFPRYSKELLKNAIDIDFIEDQIYLLKGSGANLRIEVLDLDHHQTVPICDLGSHTVGGAVVSWSQSAVGLTALSWSDRLIDSTPPPYTKTGVFLINTASGERLTAVVNWTGAHSYSCSVSKDSTLQATELMRASGTTSTASFAPYSLSK